VDDARAIGEVQIASWQSAYAGMIPQEHLDGLSIDVRVGVWEPYIAGGARPGLLVAVDEDRVVGFVGLGASRDADAGPTTGEVGALYLAPSHWRRGIGEALVAAGLPLLADDGFTEATLWVLARNERGRAFYEATGWALDGAECDEVIGGQVSHEVRYRRRLTPPSSASR